MSNTIESPLTALSDAMAEAVAMAAASTVVVDARKRLPASGIAYTEDLVLTADHVVQRHEDIRVVTPDGIQHEASFVGHDPGSDLALLRLGSAVLHPAETAPADADIGQLVLALGRPNSEGIQASLGVVSAFGGPVHTHHGGLLERYLRTDAIPYPGFSGGPLIDASGRVLGLNTSGLTRGSSITIPASHVWEVAETIARHGQVPRGFLGIRTQPVELPEAQRAALEVQQNTGLLVVGVEAGSPADQGGMLVGDILVALAGSAVAEPDELLSRLTGDLIGKPTQVEVLRGSELTALSVIIGERK